MDTRNKIVSAETARARLDAWRAAGTAFTVVAGLFDPMLAAHAELLESVLDPAARVLVQLEEGADPVLSLQDRCELVAALRCVDLVCAGALEAPEHDFRARHEEWKQRFRSSVIMSAATPAP